MSAPYSISQALNWACRLLVADDNPAQITRVLLGFVLGENTAYLLTWPEKKISPEMLRHFKRLVERRRAGEPVAYILGYRDFWTLTLNVNSQTLIPRSETERLVELALERIQAGDRVLDLGTGSGAIALAIASERDDIEIVAVDRSTAALDVARGNRDGLGLHHVQLLQSDWGLGLGAQTFNLIVANPPYVRPGDPHLSQGDVRFEPGVALVAHENGLGDIAKIINYAQHALVTGGWLLFEHGFDQAQACLELLSAAGFEHCRGWKDLSGIDRISGGQTLTRHQDARV